MPTLSLDAIQQRIAKQDSELQTLRRELEARQSRLQALSKRKQELRDQLRRIDSEMAAVTAGAKRPTASSLKTATAGAKRPNAGSPKPVKKVDAKPPASKPTSPTLANLIIAIVQDAGRALTVQQITKAVKQRGFPTKSKALHKLVGKNAYGLATKGLLRRTDDYPAAFAVSSGSGKSAPASATKPGKAAGSAPVTAKPKPAVKEAAKRTSGTKPLQKPLRQVLTETLKKMGAPLTGSELAEEVLKAGYQTTSKNLVNNIWGMLGQMDNVEKVEGEGYRLKRKK